MADAIPQSAAAWDAVAPNYVDYAEAHTGLFAADAWRLIGAPAGVRVLDVATGTGAFARLAAETGAEVLATDISPAMVAVAADRLCAAGGGEARVMDGQALKLPDAAFDIAASIFGVVLFPDPVAGLAELVRVVRPGGTVALGAWRGGGSGLWSLATETIAAVLPDRAPSPLPPATASLFSLDALAAALDDAGLTGIALHPVAHDWVLPGADWLGEHADRIFAFSPQWAAIPADDRMRVVEAMVAHVAGLSAPRLRSTATIALARRAG